VQVALASAFDVKATAMPLVQVALVEPRESAALAVVIEQVAEADVLGFRAIVISC
jgi:hypothetical protein